MSSAPQTVVVTNVSSGQSATVARAFGRRGDHVVLTDPDPGAAQKSTAEMPAVAGQRPATAIALDPADLDACGNVLSSIAEANGGIDVWVNGFVPPSPARADHLADSDGALAVTAALARAMNGCLVAGAHMAERGRGVIVNLMSVAALQRESGEVAESVISSGLWALTEALGVEWAKCGVRVVGVASGGIGRPVTDRLPSMRQGTDEDVAEAVLFVASAEASFLTAETLVVDGGWSAYQMF